MRVQLTAGKVLASPRGANLPPEAQRASQCIAAIIAGIALGCADRARRHVCGDLLGGSARTPHDRLGNVVVAGRRS